MGHGANVTRISSIFNHANRGNIVFENPEHSADNMTLFDGFHEFPYGRAVSIPWSWERAIHLHGQGSLWREGQDVRYVHGRRPNGGFDGQVIFTHTHRLEEEYLIIGLKPDGCHVSKSVNQLSAIFNNVNKPLLGKLDGAFVQLVLENRDLAVQLATIIDEGFANVDPAGIQALSRVTSGQWQTAVASLTDADKAVLASGDKKESIKVADKVLERLQIAVGTYFGLAAAVATILAAAFAGTVVLAIFFGIVAGLLAIVGVGAEGALAVTRFILSFFA